MLRITVWHGMAHEPHDYIISRIRDGDDDQRGFGHTLDEAISDLESKGKSHGKVENACCVDAGTDRDNVSDWSGC
jgi:hypothetical protein